MGVPGFELTEDVDDSLPDEFEHIVVWHADIRNRQSRGQQYEPIGLQEIEAYLRKLARVGVEMEPLDEDLLCIADGLWMEIVPDRASSTPE